MMYLFRLRLSDSTWAVRPWAHSRRARRHFSGSKTIAKIILIRIRYCICESKR